MSLLLAGSPDIAMRPPEHRAAGIKASVVFG
jgi:hypothetical protein